MSCYYFFKKEILQVVVRVGEELVFQKSLDGSLANAEKPAQQKLPCILRKEDYATVRDWQTAREKCAQFGKYVNKHVYCYHLQAAAVSAETNHQHSSCAKMRPVGRAALGKLSKASQQTAKQCPPRSMDLPAYLENQRLRREAERDMAKELDILNQDTNKVMDKWDPNNELAEWYRKTREECRKMGDY